MHEEIAGFNIDIDGLLYIDLSGRSFCDGTYRIDRRQSDYYVFEFIEKGRGNVVHDGQELTASGGDVYVLKKGERQRYYSSKDDPWTKIWFNVSGPIVDSLISLYHIDKTIYAACDAFGLFESFVKLTRKCRENPYAGTECILKLHEIISFIAFYNQVYRRTDADTLKNYLESHIREQVSIDELCRLIYKSPSQTIRIFKDRFGATPLNYHAGLRISMAKTLLRNTGLSVKQIASELNFADEHYFSNVFKKSTSFSPRAYRRSEEETTEK